MVKPLLTVVMMVKDEADCIEATLATAKPFVDRWLVYDTGSTDGTQRLAQGFMADLPGRLVEEPFVSMSHSRNRSVDLAGTETEFLLMLDADDKLVGGDALRSHLEMRRFDFDYSAFFMRTNFGVVFDMCKVIRTGMGWHFEGVAHEQLVHPTQQVRERVPDVQVDQIRTDLMDAKSKARWEREEGLLRARLDEVPDDTRSAFYLAQTLTCLGRHEEALEAHYVRIAMGGWWEEVYQSWMRAAWALRSMGNPWPDQMEAYLEAFKVAPHRAEPLFAIGDYYRLQNEHHLGYVFARRAVELPYPGAEIHVVDHEIYEWKAQDLLSVTAYYVGDNERGEAAARAALAARPDDDRLALNVGYYVERHDGSVGSEGASGIPVPPPNVAHEVNP